jgi:hypothetical protein
MVIRIAGALFGLMVGWGPVALAQQMLPSTSCAAASVFFHEDPFGPGAATRRDELGAWMMKFVPPGADATTIAATQAMMTPGVINWCALHPLSTVGQAVDQAGQAAHLVPHDVMVPQSTLLEIHIPDPLPANLPPDAQTVAAVALFRKTCLGLQNRAALLAWAAARHVPAVPPGGLAQMGLNMPGQGFVVTDQMILALPDSGECQVLVHFGVLEQYETALQGLPQSAPGFSIRAKMDQIDPQHAIVQRAYDWEGKAWSQDVLVVSRPYVPALPGGPMIVLQAKPRVGGI